QLEYREMIPMTTRYTYKSSNPPASALQTVVLADWEECYDGDHILVSDAGVDTGTLVQKMYPIHSSYTRHRFHSDGTLEIRSLPRTVTDAEIEAQARSVVPDNQKGKNTIGADMSTDDYVQNYWEALYDHFRPTNPGPLWSSSFYVPQTATEILNIDPDKMDNMRGFVSFDQNKVQDMIGVNGIAGVGSSVALTGRNDWGLINMHGNLAEWTKTTWDGKRGHTDPVSVTTGYNVVRGGSFQTSADRCRSAARTARKPAVEHDDVGFRFIIRN
ncbi:MAG: SUMF1/EgtB/PvdO family nonheme iron enzyme, partial [Planctomycetes bacterium]|nr:SUMF1/EgtB/PvdO family nonheme iron enzyme [Planctomycetota bacterium]